MYSVKYPKPPINNDSAKIIEHVYRHFDAFFEKFEEDSYFQECCQYHKIKTILLDENFIASPPAHVGVPL